MGEEESSKTRNCWRRWKQLSRFQRSLIYMLFIITCITLVFIQYNRKHVPDHVSSSETTHKKISHLPRVVEPVEVDQKFGIDKEEHNLAEEYKDDDDEDDEKDADDYEGGDSNHAEEE